MKPLRVLVTYFVVVFLGGAALAPWLYWLAQSFGDVFPKIAGSPFHRFVNRSLLGLALAGLWPLLRSLGATSLRDVGLVKPSGQWMKLGGGFALGFLSLASVALVALASGARALDVHQTHSGQRLLNAAGVAAVVAVLEEILFRGALFGALRKALDFGFALLSSSMIYAIVHFMGTGRLSGAVAWYSGFELLPQMLRGFANWQAIIPGFFTLTLAGILLGLAYQRTGNLYCSIGLHAGWIFWLKSYGLLTRPIPGADPWLWGSNRMTDGWLGLFVLSVTLLLFTCLPVARKPKVNLPAVSTNAGGLE